MAKFELKSEDIQRLESAIKNYQGSAEDVINKVLHKESAEKVTKSIQNLINISKKKRGTHARHGKPFKTEPFNLGFFIKTYPKYGYLTFPDEGRGIRNKVAQDFTGRGIERERPKVVNRLMEVLVNKFEEEMR